MNISSFFIYMFVCLSICNVFLYLYKYFNLTNFNIFFLFFFSSRFSYLLSCSVFLFAWFGQWNDNVFPYSFYCNLLYAAIYTTTITTTTTTKNDCCWFCYCHPITWLCVFAYVWLKSPSGRTKNSLCGTTTTFFIDENELATQIKS